MRLYTDVFVKSIIRKSNFVLHAMRLKECATQIVQMMIKTNGNEKKIHTNSYILLLFQNDETTRNAQRWNFILRAFIDSNVCSLIWLLIGVNITIKLYEVSLNMFAQCGVVYFHLFSKIISIEKYFRYIL